MPPAVTYSRYISHITQIRWLARMALPLGSMYLGRLGAVEGMRDEAS